MRLKKICVYEGSITLITGLAIKGSSNELNIGGADNEVIKNPLTGEPYIPGSSLKGKMRSQLERVEGARDKEGAIQEDSPCKCGNCVICRLFGAHMNVKAKSAPTRMIVRDCTLTDQARRIISDMPLESGSYLEVKAENLINRRSGTAESPRNMERVPAGLSFDLEICVQIFDGDNEKEFKEYVEKGLRLVELSYLGGSGSRGYGQVKFNGSWKEIEV